MARAPRPDHVNLHRLPPQLRQLVRIMGESAAFRLVELRGGTVLCVPKHMSPDHDLLQIVGPIAFAQLVDALPGQPVQLPKYDSVMRQVRHQRVIELRRHCSVAETALKTSYTMRQVINICNAAEADLQLQGDLFAPPLEPDEKSHADNPPVPTANDPFGLASGKPPGRL